MFGVDIERDRERERERGRKEDDKEEKMQCPVRVTFNRREFIIE